MFPLQGIAAWIFPGAGHFAHGQHARGAVIMIAVLSIWLWGWLIGGLTAFDRREHPVWFGCQAMTAPSFGVSLLLDMKQPLDSKGNREYSSKPPPPSPDVPFEPSYGRANELGILFTALAGLMNLLAICDAGLNSRPRNATPAAGTQATVDAPPGERVARWSVVWPRLATAAIVLVGVGLAVPLRLLASVPQSPAMLPYRPFIDPMPWNDAYWMLTIVPLALAVSTVYRSVRCDDMKQVPGQAVILTAQVVGSMVLVAAVVWAMTRWL